MRLIESVRPMVSGRLHRALPVGVVACLLGALAAGSAGANEAAPPRWMISVGKADYTLDARGSVLDNDGAHVELAASPGRTSPMGSSVATVDAAAFRGHTVKLSGLITTTDAPGGAGLWLRADGPRGRLAFANSQASLVTGTSSGQAREVTIVVPPSTTKLVFGSLLLGDGRASVDHLLLSRGTEVSPKAIVPAQAEFDAAVVIIKPNALRSSSVDWDTLVPKLRDQVGKDDWSMDAYPEIRELLAALQDHHSHLLSPEEAMAVRSPETAVTLPTVELQREGVGYVVLPAFNSTEPHHAAAYAEAALSGMARITGGARAGWILDLRKDGGGNMWPMLAALRPFLGASDLGYFRGAGRLSTSWKTQLDQQYPDVASIDLGATPLAVLTGPHTASAGEAVAIALKGRPHTRFFGMPTMGMPTGNRTYPLPDGAAIALTVTVELDRNHVEYDGPIQPDVVVTPSAQSGESADNTMAAAQRWLSEGGR